VYELQFVCGVMLIAHVTAGDLQ